MIKHDKGALLGSGKLLKHMYEMLTKDTPQFETVMDLMHLNCIC